MAITDLPWLPRAGQFLQAMEAGSQRANQIAQLRQQATRDTDNAMQGRYRNQAAILAALSGGGVNPAAFAQADAIRSDTAREEQALAGEAAAAAENERLQSLGVDPQSAFYRSGLFRFGFRPPATEPQIADKVFEVGKQVVRINPITGKSDVLYQGPEDPVKEPTFDIPVEPPSIFGQRGASLRLTPTQLQGVVSTLPEYARTNAATKAVLQLAAPGAGAATPAARGPAQGGYVVGKVYGGLRYLGGNPNEEANWERTR